MDLPLFSLPLAIARNQQWSVSCLDQQFALGSRALHVRRTILAADGSTVRAISNYNMDNGFTSRRHETETGLMYFKARYYDPQTGEFISRDPLEYVDGMSQYRGNFVPKGMDPKGTSVNDNSAQCTVGISIKGIPDPPKPRPVHTYELPFNCPDLPFCSTLSMLLFEFQVYGILQGDCGGLWKKSMRA